MTTHRQGGAEACLVRMQAMTQRGVARRAELALIADWLDSEHARVRRCAAETLALLGRHQPVVHELLMQRLRDAGPRTQWGALYALALMERLPAGALPILLHALGSRNADVRWATVRMLVGIKGEPGLEAAVRDLARAGVAVQRKMAAYCLRDFGFATPETQTTLVGLLKDEQGDVRLAAVSGLSRVASHRALAACALVSVLVDDANPGVRRAAAVALGRLGEHSPEVIAALRRAARGTDQSLRRAAERSLLLLNTGVRTP